MKNILINMIGADKIERFYILPTDNHYQINEFIDANGLTDHRLINWKIIDITVLPPLKKDEVQTFKLNSSCRLEVRPMAGGTHSARIYKNDETMPTYGTHFGKNTTIEDIKYWANEKVNVACVSDIDTTFLI